MYDVIIIGAGPAGLMAAIQASKKYKVLLLEKNEKAGKKLLITGGGRCNLTNLKNNHDFLNEVEYHKKYLYSTIHNFGPADIHQFFMNQGVSLKEEKENQIFPVSNQASEILECLLNQLNDTVVKYNEEVIQISIDGDMRVVETLKGVYRAKRIIIATGGTSYKITGSTGDHMKFAEQLDQPVTPLFPAETSVILNEVNGLAGTSFDDVIVYYKKIKKQGNLIFTHKGMSGTSIMKLSEHLYLNPEKEITIDFKPNMSKEEILTLFSSDNREKLVATCLSQLFTKRFSSYLVDYFHIRIDDKVKHVSPKVLNNLVEQIKRFPYVVAAVDTIEHAYVTGGGIDLKGINTKTMESAIHKGIYYVGEALDIHGPIGGYNITLALSTGYTAGKHL